MVLLDRARDVGLGGGGGEGHGQGSVFRGDLKDGVEAGFEKLLFVRESAGDQDDFRAFAGCPVSAGLFKYTDWNLASEGLYVGASFAGDDKVA